MSTTENAAAAVATPPDGATAEELVRWAFERINAHDTASLRPLWRDEVMYLQQGVRRGPDEIAGYFDEAFAAMPDLKFEIVKLVADGGDVFVRWLMNGTFSGDDLQGIVANGTRIKLPGVDHFVIRDGRIVTNHVTVDWLDLARQVGLLPADGTLTDKASRVLFNLKTKAVAKLRR